MPVFRPDAPVTTDQPRVVVQPGLKPGRYRFALVVCNEAGERSDASEWIVTIDAPRRARQAEPARSRSPLWWRLWRRLGRPPGFTRLHSSF
jgi:hypothetical protein